MPDKFFLKQKITSIEKLPSLPAVVSKVLNLMGKVRGADIATLSEIIGKDPALTARVLRVANSPFYGFKGEISTIDRAIVVIGFDEMKSILLSTNIVNMFKKKQNHFSYNKFWQYSVTTAIIARFVAKTHKHNMCGDAFVSALLHEIGILIIDQYFPKEFEEIIKNVNSKKTLLASEVMTLGVNHKDVGCWLVEKWNLPSQFSDVLQHYDSPELADKNKLLCSIVHLSIYLTKKMKAGATLDTELKISETIWSIFETNGILITPDDEDTLMEKIRGEIEKHNDFIALITTH